MKQMQIKPFDECRAAMEKQYENAVYPPETGWSPEQLRGAWEDFKKENPDCDRLLETGYVTAMLLRHAPIAVEKENPFPGKFLDKGFVLRDLFYAGFPLAEQKVPGVNFDPTEFISKYGVVFMVDKSHSAPDWKTVLRLGIPGLIQRAKEGNTPFHRSVQMVFEGLAEFCRRVGTYNENQVYLEIAEHAPQTLHEAFALAVVFHDCIEQTFQLVRSMGKFDDLYIDFYRKDIEEGRLTRESAKELIKYFWIVFYARHQGKFYGKNFCFGPVINELSYLGMEAFYEMNIVDPKLSVILRGDTPRDFVELYARSIRDGRTSIVSLNYDVIVDGMIKHGRKPEDAAEFIPIGCYEPAVAGKEISCSGGNSFYLPVPLMNAVNDGKEYETFEHFKDAVKEQMRKSAIVMQEQQIYCDVAWKYVLPCPLLSGTYESCMKRGRDISDAGAEYNSSGCVISYFGDFVDSLTAVRCLVYDEKLCTMSELRTILEKNWEGYDRLRKKVLRLPQKWGNNNAEAIGLGKEFATYISDLLWTLPNARGGTFYPALFGQKVVETGADFGAFPSGRKAGEPLTKNMGAVIGMDKNGITGLMNSILQIDMSQFPDGTCTDIMLHPSSVTGEGGVRLIADLITTFIKQGGSGIQFNIFDAGILRDAQKHPEKYENLQVRVCGWNVRFMDLSPAAQETFIREAEAAAS